MSRTINYTSATTQMLLTSSATTGSNNFTTSTGAASAVTNAYRSADSTSNYARLQLSSSQNSTKTSTVYFEFDKTPLSEIPSNAEITSVNGRIRYNVSSTQYVTSASTQLYSSTTAKGNACTARTTTATLYTMTAGTWTLSELQNIRLYVSATHSRSQTAAYLNIYGVDVTVNYSVNGTEYEVSISNNASDVTTDPSTTQYVFEGGGQDIKIYADDIDDIIIQDNGTDITSSVVEHQASNNSASVDSVAGASYGFSLDGTYYKSQNTGQSSSAAVCRLNITADSECTLTIYFVNYAEATYDYGIIGNLDSALSTTSATTTDAKWIGSASSSNTNSEQSVVFDVSQGSHFVDIKYRKDSYTDSNNDAFWFRYTLDPEIVQHHYSYAISGISSDHIITIEDASGTFYTASTVSSYSGATVTPSEKNVREGSTFTASISVANLYEIVVKDNGTVVTGNLVQNSTGYTYTTPAVHESHSITVEENTYYNVTASSTYTGATAVANPSKVYSGQSSTISFNVANLYEIVIKDNGTVISVNEPSSGTVTLNPSSFIETASAYASISSSYPASNGLTNSASTTICAVSAVTGSNAVSEIVYGFDCSSIPQNAVIDSVVCYAKASASTNYFTTRTLQLYAGSTAKGTAVAISNSGGTTVSASSWARAELNDIRLVIHIERGTSYTTTSYAFRFYGADLVINYSVPSVYTLSNVNADHAITVEEAPKYEITAQSKYAGVSVSPATQYVYSGQSGTVSLSGNLSKITLKDNGNDVTSAITNSAYTITNVSTSHAVVVHGNVDYMKIDGTFQEVRKYYIKVNDAWVQTTKNVFLQHTATDIFVYGGHQSGTTTIGEVETVSSTINITIDDDALDAGTYTMVYEDENRTPLANVDKITEFTVS